MKTIFPAQAILCKIESNHNNLRTNEISGSIFEAPEVGNSVVLVGEALDSAAKEAGAVRMVRTSAVEKVRRQIDGTYVFKTRNSTYELVLVEKRAAFQRYALLCTTIMLSLLGLYCTSFR